MIDDDRDFEDVHRDHYERQRRDSAREEHRNELRARLHAIVSEVLAVAGRWEDGAAADAGFDGGEWSGPAAARGLQRDVLAVLKRAGFDTAADFEAEVDEAGLDGEEEADALALLASFGS